VYTGEVGAKSADLLRTHPLLARLAPEQLVRFAEAGELEPFQPGEEIVVEGTLGDSLYLIVSGAAEVHVGSIGQPLAVLRAGEFFGEMSLLEPAMRSATVRAAESSTVFRVPHYALANLLQDDPVVLNLVLVMIVRALSQRLRHTNQLVGSPNKLSEWLAGSLV
jgi:CRP-like cAMP-binding protein